MIETIFEIAVTLLFIRFFFKALKLTFKITWGLVKIAAIILFLLSIPAFIGCLLCVGGIALLIPLALIGAAFGLVKSACII